MSKNNSRCDVHINKKTKCKIFVFVTTILEEHSVFSFI